ncbi:hypothetical protein DPMN_014341 [Dreissena polymorpha]|uniref:Uncharacterized protein n=1 Tax=Dreissena polymorpha TaxID=45954 RepID=A0A9D4S3D1_DREPO|nr:hypothetical protein DPMN_014341 [Dreissena polymorpha]
MKQMTLETQAATASRIEPVPIEIQIEERTTSLEEQSEGGWRLVTQLNIFH